MRRSAPVDTRGHRRRPHGGPEPASDEKTAGIGDAQSNRNNPLLTLRSPDGISHAAFSGDGTRVVTTDWGTTARIWDAYSGKELLVLKGRSTLAGAAFSPDG